MQQEIGSNFWINPKESLIDNVLGTPEQFGCLGADYVWMSTGRSATRFVIKTIGERKPSIEKKVLLPPFTCYTVIVPFIKAGYDVAYYHVDSNLCTTFEEIANDVRETGSSIVLFHRYYGFDSIKGNINSLKDVITIEDCTQCLYSNINKCIADYTLGSIRKWLGTPDGGFAVCAEGVFNNKPSDYDQALEDAKVKASYHKFEYLFEDKGEKSVFLREYGEAEEILDEQKDFFTIGNMSAKLQGNLNKDVLVFKRRDNFCTLLENLPDSNKVKPLFTELDSDSVPLYFPVVVEDRQTLQILLREHAIYAPVVWPRPDEQDYACEEAAFLYNHLLCIPIDQRYDEDDMMRVISVIKQIL